MHTVTRRLAAATLGALLVVSLAPAAIAGPPGKWTKVSDGSVVNFYEPGLFRTPDKRLHIAFLRAKGGSKGYGHTTVNLKGATVSTDKIFSGWSTLFGDPELIDYRGGDGIRLVFSGIHGGGPSDPYNSGAIFTATTDNTGASWDLSTGSMSKNTNANSIAGIAATSDGGNVPIAGWSSAFDVYWHRGVDASNPAAAGDQTTTSGIGCCLYNTAMATDRKTDDVWLAWYSNQSGNGNGTWVKRIWPMTSGNKKVPNSSASGQSVNFSQEVAMAPRIGGGVYLANCVGYPTCARLQLWKVGTTKKWTIPQSKGATDVALATGPKGRMWIAWIDPSDRVRAVRTNTSATAFGTVRNLGRPGAFDTLFQIAGEGSTGRMDVIVNVGNGLWHTQALAGLSMTATPKTFDNATKKTVKFVVTDAKQAVAGARVSMGGKATKTNSKGVAFLTFPAGFRTGIYTATAKKAGYYRAVVKVKVT